jgi:hypothetical protein
VLADYHRLVLRIVGLIHATPDSINEILPLIVMGSCVPSIWHESTACWQPTVLLDWRISTVKGIVYPLVRCCGGVFQSYCHRWEAVTNRG